MRFLCHLSSRLLSHTFFVILVLVLSSGTTDAKNYLEHSKKDFIVVKTKHSIKIEPKSTKVRRVIKTKLNNIHTKKSNNQNSQNSQLNSLSSKKRFPSLKTSLNDTYYPSTNRYKTTPYTITKSPSSSAGVLAGLRDTPDPLALKSSVAFVVDAKTGEVLLDKNSSTALPIASITKLMTALVVMDSHQDLDEILTIEEPDLQLEKQVRSRLGLGIQLRRREALHLALMSSENRAANMLTRYYPGGKSAFVDAMNQKARQLGMNQSYFVEGTGLASANMASAQDLIKLMKAASNHSLIRDLSTQSSLTLTGEMGQLLSFHSTNRLVNNPEWTVLLQKTGFINAAGQCLVMHALIDGRSVMMVLLDSEGKLSRINDAARIRSWLLTQAANDASSLPYPYPS
jgi:serine-type D-Ala-D-Ala endopeptidase (penicillin-binding protein 7)